MKTNQIMIRQMGEFSVKQRTKDGFFNATELLKQWNRVSGMKKEVTKFLDLGSTSELVKIIMEREDLHTQDSTYVKSRASRGDNAGTWMHPVLFIDFAMWINPSFKYDVIKFVYDDMIRYRNLAGDSYKELASAISKIVSKTFIPKDMQKVGEALNWIVFDSHEPLLRNKHGNESKQRELWQLEKKVADLINEGFILDYDILISYLRKQYQKRNLPNVFQSESNIVLSKSYLIWEKI